MLLEHPHVAALECIECQQWIYDIKTGDPILRRGEKQRRAPGQATPCRMCPKKSPEHAETLRLTPANVATLRLYWRNRATMGCLNDAERSDPYLQRNFAIIDATIRGWELKQSIGFAAMVLGAKG